MEKRVESYRDLLVWQRGMALVEAVYRETRSFPRSEVYGLVSQMRRAAVSVPANVAEGHGRRHRKEYLHFLSTAHGSLMELETHVVIAERLGYLHPQARERLLSETEELGRMLNGLMRALSRPPRASESLSPDP
jgi:four helix bundle protein